MHLTAAGIRFRPLNLMRTKTEDREFCMYRVATEAPDWAVSATIVNGVHISDSDRRPHITVGYFRCNGYKQRFHVLETP